jgi:hypothetical protein
MKLPDGVLQPFELRFFADDLHVMAFIDGHPKYESVEAMIRRNADGTAAVRAILTRGDQSQIDHVNEHALVRTAVAGRETHFSEIAFSEPPAEPEPGRAARAVVEFTSCDGESVLLDVVSAGLPDTGRGGLSSPGTHALHGALPLMVRGASALASERTRVVIDGRPYAIPEKFRTPQFVAYDGYFTRSHHMAIVRAGEIVYEMRRAPQRMDVGAEWAMRTADGERCYRITAVDADGTIRARRLANVVETVTFAIVDGSVDLRALRVGDERDPDAFVEISFDGDDAFAIGVDGVANQVEGTIDRHANGFTLRPTRPDWAVARPVRVTVARREAWQIVTTSIGIAGG